MEEKTADEIAAIFSAAGDSVTVINADANLLLTKLLILTVPILKPNGKKRLKET